MNRKAISLRALPGLARLQQLIRDYSAVQDEAAMESMRRIRFTFWLFGPIEVALALWYARYQVAPNQLQMQAWADSLFWLHAITALVTGVLLFSVHKIFRRPRTSTRIATTMQVMMCFTYLMYGVAVSYFDIAVGGVEAFILICFGVAGVSLMRPSISLGMFGITFIAVAHMLHASGQSGAQLSIMLLNTLIAATLSVVISAIIFHQYARGILLRRDLEIIAGQDALTKLPNRREMMSRLRMALHKAGRSAGGGALLFVDLDNFKNINDTRGHPTGDLLLQEVGLRIANSVRASDTVGRLGGDEFLVLIESADQDTDQIATQAECVGQKILHCLGQPYCIDGLEMRSTSSIGVALYRGHETSVDELLKQADLAMYQAKYAGRNAIRFFDTVMHERLLVREALEADLRQALVQGGFVLYFQPQVRDGQGVVGAEALVRWHHVVRGLVSPGHFIPLAEEVGLIVPLGDWVLEQACEQLARWSSHAQTDSLSIAVNVSAAQFRQVDYVQKVQGTLEQTGANPRRLKLELTESMLAANLEDVVAKMNALSALGIRFALDDFGTGYSSLSYLKRLPIDQLKIDQSFVKDVVSDTNDAVIVKVMIGLADALGIEVLAEGVEQEVQRNFLAQAGCVRYQGYFFGRPMPIAEFERTLLTPA